MMISEQIIEKSKKNDKMFFCPYCNRMTISPKNIKDGIIMCAMCASFQRHRFLYYVYLKEFLQQGKNIKVLHFAPEKSIYDFINKFDNIDYVCCDLQPQLYPYAFGIRQEDGMSLSFNDNTFDIIIHNHILEHVPDDIEFIQETLRVLKDDGKILISIPYYKNDLCDDHYKTDEERTRYYGLADHVRKYGKDILKKFSISGLKVNIINQNDYLTNEELACIKSFQDSSEDLYMIMQKK